MKRVIALHLQGYYFFQKLYLVFLELSNFVEIFCNINSSICIAYDSILCYSESLEVIDVGQGGSAWNCGNLF